MFWGLTLEPGKRYTKTVDNPFHISAAVLDTSACDDDVVRVIVEVDDSETETIIANLSLKHGILQSQLDLQFESGSHVAFYTQGGASSVHLSGYNVFDVEEAVEEEESSDEETPVLLAKETAKRKIDDSGASTSKKAKLTEWDTPKNSMKKMHKKTDVHLDELKDEDSDEDEDSGEEEEDSEEDEDTDEDEDSEDEEAKEVVVKSAITSVKTENLSKQTNIFKESKAAEPNSVLSKTPKSEQKNIKKEKTPKQELKTPNKQKGKPATPEKTPVTQDKAAPKNKTPKQDVNAINGKTPKSEKAAKNADKLKNTPVTPHLIQKSPKVVKSGGVTCEDIVVGNGPEAKRGNMISVYYEGRLMNNKKMFDKCDSGKGFKFRLGMGEVISGWDVGVSGMKVGGKRRIICPPQMAYGKKGAPPDIPPQSTLMFMVELKGIN